MRIVIAIIAGLLAGLAVRALRSPTVQEITEPPPSYSEAHETAVALAESKIADAQKQQREIPLNPAYSERLSVTGYIARGNRVNVILSDGTTWTEKTPGLERIERSHVVFQGKSYPIKSSVSDSPRGVVPTAAIAHEQRIQN